MAQEFSTPSALICLLWTVFVTLFVSVLGVTVSASVSTAHRTSTTTTTPTTVQLLATYETSNQQQFLRILQKAVNEANVEPSGGGGGGGGFQLSIISAVVDGYSIKTIKELCRLLDNNNISAIVSVADVGITLAAVSVGGYAGLPVLGFAPGYADHLYTDLNSFFQPLNPTLDHMADALSTFLLANSWLSTTILMDDSLTSMTLNKKLVKATKNCHPHSTIVPVIMPQSASPKQIFDAISEIAQLRSRVLIVHCSRPLTNRIFEQAKRLGMATGQWIWLLVGDIADVDVNVNVNNNDDDSTTHSEFKRPVVNVNDDGYQDYPSGVLAMRIRPTVKSKHVLRMAVRLVTKALREVWASWRPNTKGSHNEASCWFPPSPSLQLRSKQLFRELRRLTRAAVLGEKGLTVDEGRAEASLKATFDLLNLVEGEGGRKEWRSAGNITGGRVSLDAVIWPGNTLTGPSPLAPGFWRVAAALAPPFVMTSEPLGNHSCLVGVPCLRVKTDHKQDVVSICADYKAGGGGVGGKYNVTCCHGYSIDLLVVVAKELRIDYVVYIVADNRFGSWKVDRWDGIMSDLISGTAHLAFAPMSVTAARSHYIDFSTPYYFSGVSFITSTKFREVPLLAFLAPFSPGLWIAIFMCLHVIAVTAAVYEWLSPFGLNPWGRQRTKNFSLASALWVTWSLLFSHLVAFKAPKSWPNKVLINLWGCFSVIFLASYTANIAALFAGLFFQTTVNDFNDQSLLIQRVGTARGTAGESYLATKHRILYEHMKRFNFSDIEEGVSKLRNGELDLLVGDTPVLDFYRGQEPGCTLRAVGPIMNEDTYAVGMTKGSPLKDPISSLIAKYNENGYLDYLTARWYHGLPCMRTTAEMYRPMRLSISAVAGVFIMLSLGMGVGLIILCLEHVVYKHVLPDLRKKPKGTVWKSPNLMFFSQKLYRFINCVELVSPHHSAKELVNNIRTGQITSLFQKSIKRKEHEQRRRRKSKAQFFEMIQEIRRLRRSSKDTMETGRRSRAETKLRLSQDDVLLFDVRVNREAKSSKVAASDSMGTTDELFLTPDGDQRGLLSLEGSLGPALIREEVEDVTDLTAIRRATTRPVKGVAAGLPYYSDDSCVRLIEKVASAQHRSSSCSSDSSDETRPCLTPISASLTELYSTDETTTMTTGRGGRGRRRKVHSYDDLKCWTRPPPNGDSDYPYPYHRHRHRRSYHYPPSDQPCSMHGRNNFLRDMPMTKFDFFDLPLRLNDARLEKLSKEDIVFLWQTSEKELRRRLHLALQEKRDLERQLRNKNAAIDEQRQKQPP